jgi:hypothetical protein
MTSTLRHTALAAAMGALAFVPSPAVAFPSPAAANAADDKKTVEQRLEDLEKKMNRVLEHLEGRKDETGARLPSDPGLIEEVRRLKNELASLRTEVNGMKSSTSFRVVDPLAGKGTVRVVNEYPVEISIVVNSLSYRLAPSEKRDILVPAGEFRYQLLTAGAGETRSVIREKETVTLRIK